jgi:hypothetical protein
VKHSELYFVLLISGLLVLAAARWCWGPHSHLPRFRVRVMRLRLYLRLHPGRGHASAVELWLRWGRFAALRRSGRSRRSLTAWQRIRRPDQHSLVLGRAHYRHGLRVPLEEHVLVMAPPRTGKTGLLARIILHYPGPVVSTTTKHDVFQLTSGIRSRLGPVHVFNPQRVGGVPSTFRWNPVAGCQDPATAIRRADGFAHAVNMSGTEDGSFWSSKASDYLRCLFHAAAVAGGDMRLVARWALGSAEPAEDLLARAGADQWAAELAELRSEAQKTAATIKMVLSRALGFMTGITDTATLKMASELCGQAAFTERVRFHGRGGERGEQRRVWHDVMTPDMVRQLPASRALVIRGSHAPVIARLGAAWKDPAYKAARRAGAAIAHITPAPEPAAQPGSAAPAMAGAQRWLRAVPDLDVEAAGEARGDDPAYPWS